MQEFEKLSCGLEPINFLNFFQQQARLAEAPGAREQTLYRGAPISAPVKVLSKAGSGCHRPGKSAKSRVCGREEEETRGRAPAAVTELAGLASRSRQPNYPSEACGAVRLGARSPLRGSLSPLAWSPSALSNHRRRKAEGRLGPALPALTQVRRGSVWAQSPRRESQSATRRKAREAG